MENEVYQMAKKLKKEIEDLNDDLNNLGVIMAGGYQGSFNSNDSGAQTVFLTKIEVSQVCNLLYAERKNKLMMLEDRFKAL